MSNPGNNPDRGPATQGIVTRKAAEIGFAVLLLCFGVALVVGARDLETGWGSSGPEAGYFPLRIGILIIIAASVVLVVETLKAGRATLLDRRSADHAARFALPLVGLAVAVPYVGMYLAAFGYLLIATGLVGRAGWRVALGTAIIAPLLLFLLFEFVFRTPLPKGPLGPMLGMI